MEVSLVICLFQTLLTVRESDNIKLPMPDTISSHAGPQDVSREAEPKTPSGVGCSDFVRRSFHAENEIAITACSPFSIRR